MPDSTTQKTCEALKEAIQAFRIPNSDLRLSEELLPGLELRRGSLVEWLGEEGSGATSLALIAAREACRPQRALVVLDRWRRFYPPAAARLGIDLEGLIVVRPRNDPDDAWALTQALACPAVGAVVCWPDKLHHKAFRRLQLAAERGGSLGCLVRPVEVRGSPSWAELQLLVQPIPTDGHRRFLVTLLRDRSGNAGRRIEWELDDESNALHLAAELAPAAAAGHAAGARPPADRAV